MLGIQTSLEKAGSTHQEAKKSAALARLEWVPRCDEHKRPPSRVQVRKTSNWSWSVETGSHVAVLWALVSQLRGRTEVITTPLLQSRRRAVAPLHVLTLIVEPHLAQKRQTFLLLQDPSSALY